MRKRTPWENVPADEIEEGARIFAYETDQYATFLRIEREATADRMHPRWWLVYRGALSGAELKFRLSGPSMMIKIVREDMKGGTR